MCYYINKTNVGSNAVAPWFRCYDNYLLASSKNQWPTNTKYQRLLLFIIFLYDWYMFERNKLAYTRESTKKIQVVYKCYVENCWVIKKRLKIDSFLNRTQKSNDRYVKNEEALNRRGLLSGWCVQKYLNGILVSMNMYISILLISRKSGWQTIFIS